MTLDLGHLGWRTVFFVNVPFGLAITAAALRLMPQAPRRPGTRLDMAGAVVLFVGLSCLIGPLLFGHDVGWAPSVWLIMAAGIAILAAFLRLERRVAKRGGMPLIDLTLLADQRFMRGLGAAFFFYFANLSFYFVMTVFMQRTLHLPPLQGGLVFVPLALTFVVASRHAGARAKHRGSLVLMEGCAIQIAGLAGIAALVFAGETPSALTLALMLAIFGYGQGLVMAPLSSVVLASVKPSSAGAGSGMYGANRQCGRRCCHRCGVLCRRISACSATRIVCSADHLRVFDHYLRRISVVDASRGLKFRQSVASIALLAKFWGSTAHGLLFCTAATICSW